MTGARHRSVRGFLRVRLSAGLAFALALLLSGGCSAPAPRNLLLISIDTLRADALETYGYDRPTSPFLLELSRGAAVFENAFCPLPGTLPSHMSMLTGLYPEEHGVWPPDGVLSPEIPTLAERLAAAGFQTIGQTEGGYVHGGYGFARGFQRFSDSARHKEWDVETTLARTLAAIDEVAPTDRFFAFLHTYVVHDPYFPPERYARLFWEEDTPEGLPELTGPELSGLDRSRRILSARERAFLRARYDAQIRYLDDLLRDFFAALASRNRLDSTLVIITSDHGEEFQEHGRLLHSQLYAECLRVPLIVIDPRLKAGHRVPEIAETVDITPTVLDLLGLLPAAGLSGESLARSVLATERERRPSTSSAYAVAHGRRQHSLIGWAGEELYQLLREAPEVHDGHVYFGTEFRFDAPPGDARVGIVSLDQPRWLSIDVDGVVVARERVGFGAEGRTINIPIVNKRFKHSVTLRSDGCPDPPADSNLPGCGPFQFQLVDQGFARHELFSLTRDPGQKTEISGADRWAFGLLLRALRGVSLRPASHVPGRLADPELEARLRALGYLH